MVFGRRINLSESLRAFFVLIFLARNISSVKVCNSNQWSCQGYFCISLSWVCDGIVDCYDRSDEASCGQKTSTVFTTKPSTTLTISTTTTTTTTTTTSTTKTSQFETATPKPSSTCGVDEFKCQTTGGCIPAKWVCDGITDCADHSDELICRATSVVIPTTPRPDERGKDKCQSDQYLCLTDEKCISSSLKCNGQTDCFDGSDELFCDSTDKRTSTTTTPTTTTTTTTTTTITPTTTPDTTTTTPTTTTTTSTTTTTTTTTIVTNSINKTTTAFSQLCPTSHMFRCGSGECMVAKFKCDGINDCSDSSDEIGCVLACRDKEFRCNSGKCIDALFRCNAINNCGDNSDELNCFNYINVTIVPLNETNSIFTPRPCGSNEFHCANKLCVPNSWRCDKVDDCKDGGDEMFCNNNSPCPVDQFQCVRDGYCIQTALICNSISDCTDGQDEMNCTQPIYRGPSVISLVLSIQTWLIKPCTQTQFRCNSNNRCIPKSWKCNSIIDCSDASDESGCYFNMGACAYNRGILCDRNTKCVSLNLKCDGRFDCQDGMDEIKCYCDQMSSTVRCASGQCVNIRNWCDGKNHCPDNSDERNCVNDPCPAGAVRCDWTCLPPSYRCNGIFDCSDRTDERYCPCPYGFLCNSGHCVNYGAWCDGKPDCPDTSDEPPSCNYAPNCAPSLFRCATSKLQCVHPSAKCDNYADCADGSDELYCYT